MDNEVDGWIAQLSQCKQLSEADVKKLCDKVRVQLLMFDKARRHRYAWAGLTLLGVGEQRRCMRIY